MNGLKIVSLKKSTSASKSCFLICSYFDKISVIIRTVEVQHRFPPGKRGEQAVAGIFQKSNSWVLATGMTRFLKNRVDFQQSYLIFFGPKKRNIRSLETFKKGKLIRILRGIDWRGP